MRSMPSAHLWGKTVGEGMKECVNGVGTGRPLEWRVHFVDCDLMSQRGIRKKMNTKKDNDDDPRKIKNKQP